MLLGDLGGEEWAAVDRHSHVQFRRRLHSKLPARRLFDRYFTSGWRLFIPQPAVQIFIIRLLHISLSITVNNYLWGRKKRQSAYSRAVKLTEKLEMGSVAVASSGPNWMGDRTVKRSHDGAACTSGNRSWVSTHPVLSAKTFPRRWTTRGESELKIIFLPWTADGHIRQTPSPPIGESSDWPWCRSARFKLRLAEQWPCASFLPAFSFSHSVDNSAWIKGSSKTAGGKKKKLHMC